MVGIYLSVSLYIIMISDTLLRYCSFPQHCRTHCKDRSYCLRHRLSVDLGRYSSSVFQRCLAIWSFWTILVRFWSHYSGSPLWCSRNLPQEGCSICPYRLRDCQRPLGTHCPQDLPLLWFLRQHHRNLHAFARRCCHC